MDNKALRITESTFQFFDVSYDELVHSYSDVLYRLRKKTFNDRLGWKVRCYEDMEFDEYDNSNTRYILGMYDNQIFCSVRFTCLSQPNMITHTFHECFKSIELPRYGIESSRFFVDKERALSLVGENYPTSQLLFISMVSWAIQNKYHAIHTIVSRPMLRVLKRSGWRLTVLKEVFLSEHERIYLVSLPVTIEEKLLLAGQLSEKIKNKVTNAETWPLSLTL